MDAAIDGNADTIRSLWPQASVALQRVIIRTDLRPGFYGCIVATKRGLLAALLNVSPTSKGIRPRQLESMISAGEIVGEQIGKTDQWRWRFKFAETLEAVKNSRHIIRYEPFETTSSQTKP
jgi:hypothetical protein